MKSRLRHILISITLIGINPVYGQSPLIRVLDGAWDTAPAIEVHMLLSYVLAQYERNTPGIQWPNIDVYREEYTPITLNIPGPENQIRIGLATHGHLWSQYSFQFSHELVHVLIGRTRNNVRWPSMFFPAGWFEESLCEVGSLFTLRSMSRDWKYSPPFQGTLHYYSALWQYAQDRIDSPEHAMVNGLSFRDWHSSHREVLQSTCCNRDLNTVAAKYMLPLFEAMPTAWKAVSYLRCGNINPSESLDQVLRAWHDACPQDDQTFVSELARHLGYSIYEESGVEQGVVPYVALSAPSGER